MFGASDQGALLMVMVEVSMTVLLTAPYADVRLGKATDRFIGIVWDLQHLFS